MSIIKYTGCGEPITAVYLFNMLLFTLCINRKSKFKNPK